MLDLELVMPPTENGLQILSLVQAKKHLRISATNTAMDDEISEAIEEVGDKLHGIDGDLNRTVFPCTWRRYLRSFPERGGVIRLPYPPLIEVLDISYGTGSPQETVDPASYFVRVRDMIPEIVLTDPGGRWPSLSGVNSHRAVSVTWNAGYEDGKYPEKLRRLVKILVGHYFENKEATINDARQNMTNRAIEFGVEDLRTSLRVPVAYDNWE
jgi:hypothetical protein